ncbi:hypothetical protein ACOMHN_012958 [Nucella lapillus]
MTMFETTTATLSVSLLAAIALPLLLVLVLVGCLSCLNFFKKKPTGGFSNFSNSADTAAASNAHVNNSFAVDIEDTDLDHAESGPVTVDPLPDITAKLKVPLGPMRPRIGCKGKDKADVPLKQIVAHQPFPRSQIVYIKELGAGWFGKVIESDAEKITAGVARSKVVVKMLKDDANKDEQQLFFDEVAPFRELQHANIMRVLGQCTEINPMLMILEYAAFGNLKQYLRNHRHELASLNHKNRLIQFALDATSGLACLHGRDYLHRDLAARNCLVMTDHTLKIGDYGIAEDLFKEDYWSVKNDLLPIRWMAPETLKQEGGKWTVTEFSKESDMWSLGVVLWEIAMLGERPYDMLTDEAVLQGVIMDTDIRLPQPDMGMANNERFYEVMRFCWLEPSKRVKVEEVQKLLKQIASKAPEESPSGDPITAFEQKWEHLMPNQRHESIDSVDDQHGSVSSDDSNLLTNDDANSLEDLTSPVTAAPIALPRASRRKLSVRAVTIPKVDDSSDEAPVTGKKPAKQPPAVPQISIIDEIGHQETVLEKSGKPQQSKEPASTDTEFTAFTSHSTDDEASEDTPNVSQIASDSAPSDKTPPEKQPTAQGAVGDFFQVDALSKDQKALEDESFTFKTPEKSEAQTKTMKTSTPFAKGEASSSSSSSFSGGGDSSATFVTAHSSSPGNLTDAYATASDNTLVTDKTNVDFTVSSDFSASGVFSEASENMDKLNTTAVPSVFDYFSKSGESHTMSSSFSPPTSFNEMFTGDGAKEDGFGEFTNGSLLEGKSSSGPEEPAAHAASSALSQAADASTTQDEFFSFTAQTTEAGSKTQSNEASSASQSAVDDSNPFAIFGPDLSSLTSSEVPKAAESREEEPVLPSFSSNLSSMNSLITDSTPTPQAQPTSDIFAFDSAAPPQESGKKPVPTTDKDPQMNASGLGELGFDLISSLPEGLSTKNDVGGKESSQPGTDLAGDFSTIPLDSTSASKPLSSEGGNQGDIQQLVPDLFGFGAPGSGMQDSSFEVLDSQEGTKDFMSSSAFSDFDILGSFTSDPSSSAFPADPFGAGGNLQEFAGSSSAAVPAFAQKVGNTDSVDVSSVKLTEKITPDHTHFPLSDSLNSTNSNKDDTCRESLGMLETSSPSQSLNKTVDDEGNQLQVTDGSDLSKVMTVTETAPPDLASKDKVRSASVDSSHPALSEAGSVDVRLEDVFQWDDFIGEPLVGKEPTLSEVDSPRESFDMPDWTLDVDCESVHSGCSLRSQLSGLPREGMGSSRLSTGSADTPNTCSSRSDSEESQDDVLVVGSSSDPNKSSEGALLDFSAFESATIEASKPEEGKAEKAAGETEKTSSSLLDF